MQQSGSLVFFVALIMAVSACKKDTPEPEPEDGYEIEALQANDHSSSGIYRAVIRNMYGSGLVKVELFNGNDVARIVVDFKGQSDTLLPVHPLAKGEAYNNALFHGKRIGGWFGVGKNGESPGVSLSMLTLADGVPTYEYPPFLSKCAKERSNTRVHAYIGSYGGTSSDGERSAGTIDGVLVEQLNQPTASLSFKGTLMPEGAPYGFSLGGALDGNQLDIPEIGTTGLSLSGTVSDGVFSGTWANSEVRTSGEWKSLRVN